MSRIPRSAGEQLDHFMPGHGLIFLPSADLVLQIADVFAGRIAVTMANRRKEVELDESFGGERGGDGEEKALAGRLEKACHRAPTVVRASLGGTVAMPRASSSRST